MLQRDSEEAALCGLCPQMNTATETLISQPWPSFPFVYLRLPKLVVVFVF